MRPVIVALVFVVACTSSSHPPAASDPVADAGGDDAGTLPSLPGAPTLDAGLDSSACNACTTTKCATQLSSCSNDPSCTQCFAAFRTSCERNASFSAVAQCGCSACGSECPGTCATFGCLSCLSDRCPSEYDTCAGNPSCATCVSTTPAASCEGDPLFVALARCAQPCASLCQPR